MRITWYSNSPFAPSGYGGQTAQVGLRLRAAGHEVEFSANDGQRGDAVWEGMLVRGMGETRFGLDALRGDIDRGFGGRGADWTVALFDVWTFAQGQDPFEGLARRTAAWVPVDHYPCPPTLLPWLAKGYTAIAMSRFGEAQLRDASAQLEAERRSPFPVLYAPHAVDRSVYRPTPVLPSAGVPFRQVIGVPDDALLVGIVSANTGTAIVDRKGFGDMSAALAQFMRRHPEAYVYLHTLQRGVEGVDLPAMLAVDGVPADRIRWADQWLLRKRLVPPEDMAAIYSAMSVLLMTSRGEGFGLPAVEAQACGTPVILSNWTAQPELVGRPWDGADMGFQRHPSGWLVPVDPDYDPRHGARFGKPLIGGIIRALDQAADALSAPEGRAALRDAAVSRAALWDADAVFEEHWRPILARMEAGLSGPAPQDGRPANRAARRQLARAGA